MGNTTQYYYIYTRLRTVVALLIALCASVAVHAAGPPADTSRVVDIEEAVVTAQPKEHGRLRQQAVSSTVFSGKELAAYGVVAPKGLSIYAPNLYMPRYGSRLTSAVYVRGVGSRNGSPAVGLYVDGQPFADKSAYDFRFVDVVRTDLLRGPQGTLYGRGAMGGLLRVYTADPMVKNGTDVRLGFSAPNYGRNLSATTYLHPSRRLALSLGGFYDADEGFFRNVTTDGVADASDAAGLKGRAVWDAADRLRFDLSISYQHSKERSNPYFYDGPAGGTGTDAYPDLRGLITQNRQSSYRRDLLTGGLTTAWHTLGGATLTNTLSFQHINDRLFMDQDYLQADIFSLEQKQRAFNLSDELALKGTTGRWQRTTGIFLLYDKKHTTCPVRFYSDGMDFLNATFRTVMPSFITLTLTDPLMEMNATLDAPSFNAALFHESTLSDLFTKGLSFTAGLRLDYDYHRLTLLSPASPVGYRFQLDMPAAMLNIDQSFTTDAAFSGRASQRSWQLLPKFSLRYELPAERGNVYLTAAKGYRSGGYNLENYSDLAQAVLRRNIMLQVRDYSETTIRSLDLPDASKEAAIAGMGGMIAANLPEQPQVADLAYQPEHCWNYEAGTHLSLLEGALRADAAVFLVQTRGLQLAKFAPSGMGRIVENAGRSRTIGAELSLNAVLLGERLNLTAAYGLAHSRFTSYDLGGGTDYSGHQVPYAPQHTLALTASFRQPLRNDFFRALSLAADLTGAGRIEWDEASSFSQPFYALLGARAGVELKSGVSVEIWGRNLTNTRYHSFSFESMGRRFYQKGVPVSCGVICTLHF